MKMGFLLVILTWGLALAAAFSAGAGAAECPPWQAQDICDPPRSALTGAWALLVWSLVSLGGLVTVLVILLWERYGR